MTRVSMEASANPTERRAARRLGIRLPIECRREDGDKRYVVRTVTRNISSGGMYFELDNADLCPDDRLQIELTLPPAEGVSAYEGRATCEAEVIRVSPVAGDISRFGVAARFLQRLRFSY